jgi:hypothetical protein
MFFRLEIEIWVIGKGGSRKGCGKRGVDGERGMGTAIFCGPCVCLGILFVVVEGACVRDCRRLGLCTVGAVV